MLINSCSEVYGACRHKPHFHRYPEHKQASTDESGRTKEAVTNGDKELFSNGQKKKKEGRKELEKK